MKYSLFLPLLLIACALTPEEREHWDDRAGVDNINWSLCERAYRKAGYYTLHRNHRHGFGLKASAWDVKSDLTENNCRWILGAEWTDYY